MKSKKAEINMVFVYITSIVIIGFVGYLVVGFIGSFGEDTNRAQEQKFFNEFTTVFNQVYKSFNSEKVQEFYFPNSITFVCILDGNPLTNTSQVTFPQTMTNDLENLEFLYESGENLAIFGENGLISSFNIEEDFIIEHSSSSEPEGILCFTPVNNRQSLFFENRRNEIIISDY